MYLDPSVDVAAIRNWCVANKVKADIKPVIYRNQLHHFQADVPDADDAFLFGLRWV